MRTRCRSRLLCRMVSCTAAKGMRWVKPSKATVSPSLMLAAMASPSVVKTAISFLTPVVALGQGYSMPPGTGERSGPLLLRRGFVAGVLAQGDFLHEQEAQGGDQGEAAGRGEE